MRLRSLAGVLAIAAAAVSLCAIAKPAKAQQFYFTELNLSGPELPGTDQVAYTYYVSGNPGDQVRVYRSPRYEIKFIDNDGIEKVIQGYYSNAATTTLPVTIGSWGIAFFQGIYDPASLTTNGAIGIPATEYQWRIIENISVYRESDGAHLDDQDVYSNWLYHKFSVGVENPGGGGE
jgi:hypothetical protein